MVKVRTEKCNKEQEYKVYANCEKQILEIVAIWICWQIIKQLRKFIRWMELPEKFTLFTFYEFISFSWFYYFTVIHFFPYFVFFYLIRHSADSNDMLNSHWLLETRGRACTSAYLASLHFVHAWNRFFFQNKVSKAKKLTFCSPHSISKNWECKTLFKSQFIPKFGFQFSCGVTAYECCFCFIIGASWSEAQL